MTPEELAPFWQELWAGNESAREVLVRQFLPLANYLARRALSKAPPHQDAEDIHSYAHHGLLDAISKFRPDAGAKFETYATRRIQGAILDGQRFQDPLTRSARRAVKVMEVAVDELWTQLGREPTVTEIAAKAGLTENQIRHARLEQQTMNASLEVLEGKDFGTDDYLIDSRMEHHSNEGDAEVHAQVQEVATMVAQRLAHMPGRERAFTLLFYCDHLSMKESGEQLDLGSDWCNKTRSSVLSAISRRSSG
jgi:RNA polymerase sigma factor for flagellar operon FliA